jgi:hypothetical protein
VVEPVDPCQFRVLHVIDGSPRAPRLDLFGPEQPDDGLGQSAAVGIPDTADGRFRTRRNESLRVSNRQVLGFPVRMMDESVATRARPQSLLKRIEDQVSANRSGPRHPTRRRANTSTTKAT